jgi:predicted PurR-regulated permease PerM
MPISPEIRPPQVTFKTVFTISFGVLIVVAGVAALAHALVALTLAGTAAMISISLEHAVRLLQRRGLNRSLSIVAVMLAGLAVAVGFGFTLIPPAVKQGQEMVHNAPRLIRATRESRAFRSLDARYHIAERVQTLEQQLPEKVQRSVTPILSAVGGALSAVGATITITFLVVFMLIFGGRLIKAAVAEARPERRPIYDAILTKIYQSTGGYLGGLALICLINATLTTTFLAIDGVSFFLPLGILSGFSSMVPYAGPFIAGTGISLIALFTAGTWHGIAAGIYFIAYGQIEGNVLGPLIFRRTVHVNPLVVTLSILFFGEIAGIVGAIVAVPVVATLQVIILELLRLRREQLAIDAALIQTTKRLD